LNRAVEDDEVYKDPRLTLQSLSTRLGIQNHRLSQILNDHMGANFRTFINRLRVDEVKHLLADSPVMTILDIAYSVGFNSKSAFNTAFAKETGQPPSDYRKNHQNVLNS
jgi:AraC-like DNA-binding protein